MRAELAQALTDWVASMFHRKLAFPVLVFFVCTLAFVGSTVPPAFACSCLPISQSGFATLFDEADVVFEGVVTDKEEPFRGANTRIEITVNSVAKGKVFEKEVLWTQRSGASCGFSFSVGSTYTIYANRSSESGIWTIPQGGFETGLCGLTSAGSRQAAGVATSWHPPLRGSSPLRRSRLYRIRFSVFGVVLATGVVALVVKRRKAVRVDRAD
jgi:hypothetical protein